MNKIWKSLISYLTMLPPFARDFWGICSLALQKLCIHRAIFVWPWNESTRTKQKQETNGNRAIWLVYRTDTNARGFWLVKRTLGWKNFMPENFLEIKRYFALTSYCNTIGQSNNAFSVLGFSLAGKRRPQCPCFDLFIHWLIKQITNTYSSHFSRSYENRSTARE